MIHPDPSERATIEFIEGCDWYTKTPKATLEEAKELFEKRGLKILQVPTVSIDEGMSDDQSTPEEKKTPGCSRVPGGRRRKVFNTQHEQMRYEEIIDLIKENNKEE